MVNTPAPGLDRIFFALSEGTRRGFLARLSRGSAVVGELAAGCGISAPAVSKHLRVLEEAGLIRRERRGRTHRLWITQEGLSRASAWLETCSPPGAGDSLARRLVRRRLLRDALAVEPWAA